MNIQRKMHRKLQREQAMAGKDYCYDDRLANIYRRERTYHHGYRIERKHIPMKQALELRLRNAKVKVRCSNGMHTIELRNGRLRLLNHNLMAERVMLQISGGKSCRCLEIYEIWQRHYRGTSAYYEYFKKIPKELRHAYFSRGAAYSVKPHPSNDELNRGELRDRAFKRLVNKLMQETSKSARSTLSIKTFNSSGWADTSSETELEIWSGWFDKMPENYPLSFRITLNWFHAVGKHARARIYDGAIVKKVRRIDSGEYELTLLRLEDNDTYLHKRKELTFNNQIVIISASEWHQLITPKTQEVVP